MKRLLTLLFVAIAFAAATYAQEYRDCVHLKNGSIIKGVIIEQVIGKTLTVETADGSRFVYNLCDIVKIIKERLEPSKQERKADLPSQEPPQRRDCRERDGVIDNRGSEAANIEPAVVEGAIKKSRRSNLKRGYHGFFELKGGFDFLHENDNMVVGGMTSHGYQLSPHFYMGIGTGVDSYMFGWWNVPVFAHLRTTFFDRKVTPYIDLRGGYSFGSFRGAYFDPSVGLRFQFGKHRAGFNIGVGYTVQEANLNGEYYGECNEGRLDFVIKGMPNYLKERAYIPMPNIRIGFDF